MGKGNKPKTGKGTPPPVKRCPPHAMTETSRQLVTRNGSTYYEVTKMCDWCGTTHHTSE
jgi:hypothetical protein